MVHISSTGIFFAVSIVLFFWNITISVKNRFDKKEFYTEEYAYNPFSVTFLILSCIFLISNGEIHTLYYLSSAIICYGGAYLSYLVSENFVNSPESDTIVSASGSGIFNNNLQEKTVNPTNYDVSFIEAIRTCYKKYACCKGRSGRREFWFFTLFCFAVMFVYGFIGEVFHIGDGRSAFYSMIGMIIYYGFILVPLICVTTRRLHDVGLSGWLQLLNLTGIGALVVLYFCIKASTPYPNKYD